ncbi:ABC transporter permease [Clostridium brassicae]|uniref:ABC transporter permease n=1 Tax=Clostridium brassicae TaxID=2999072 RepID=A0ABT4D8Q8_9CLOT|nr:ABC transporter permease [Clostridium brassicae]MCY6958538.1 ABC transporter permease [Clostridium brassicae]
MIDGLYSEFLKLKRTGYYITILLVGLICLMFTTMNKQMVSSLNWYGYFFKFEFIAFGIFFTLVIPNIIAIIFVREFRYKTAPIEFSYPNGRFGALINKFLMSIIVVAIIYGISYILVILGGVIFLKTPLTTEPLINHFKIFTISFVFQVALTPLAILIALIGKSMIISLIYSMVLITGNAHYLLESKYSDYIFSILPASPIAKLRTTVCQVPIPVNMVISNSDIYLGIFIFIIGVVGCILFYRKANIY